MDVDGLTERADGPAALVAEAAVDVLLVEDDPGDALLVEEYLLDSELAVRLRWVRTLEEALVCSERFATHLLGAFATGALKPVLDRTFPLAQIADAHAYMLSDAQVGKIVVMTS